MVGARSFRFMGILPRSGAPYAETQVLGPMKRHPCAEARRRHARTVQLRVLFVKHKGSGVQRLANVRFCSPEVIGTNFRQFGQTLSCTGSNTQKTTSSPSA